MPNVSPILAFFDFEFEPKTMMPSEFGIVLSNGKQMKKELAHGNNIFCSIPQMFEDLLKWLDSGDYCFVFFGNQDIRIFQSFFKKYPKMSKESKLLCKNITNGIDLRTYLGPLTNKSLADLMNAFKLDINLPLHDPLNDCLNLKKLFEFLMKKGTNKDIIKQCDKYNGTNSLELNKKVQSQLDSLRVAIRNQFFTYTNKHIPERKNSNGKIVLLNEETKERFVLNPIIPGELKENVIYKIEIPSVVKNSSGHFKDVIIYLIEHIDGMTGEIAFSPFGAAPLIKTFDSKIMDDNELQRIFSKILSRNIIQKSGKHKYIFSTPIKLEDKSVERRLLFKDLSKESYEVEVIA